MGESSARAMNIIPMTIIKINLLVPIIYFKIIFTEVIIVYLIT